MHNSSVSRERHGKQEVAVAAQAADERKVLRIALAPNAARFVVALVAGLLAQSLALEPDSALWSAPPCSRL